MSSFKRREPGREMRHEAEERANVPAVRGISRALFALRLTPGFAPSAVRSSERLF